MGGKRLPHIFHDKFHDAVKQVLPLNGMAFHDISRYHRMINPIHDLIGGRSFVISQSHDGKPAEANVFLK